MTIGVIIAVTLALVSVFMTWWAVASAKRQATEAAARHILSAIAASKRLVDTTMLTGTRDERAIATYFIPAYQRWFTTTQTTLRTVLEPSDRQIVAHWTSPVSIVGDWQRCKELLLKQVGDLQGILPRYDDGKLAAKFLIEERIKAAG